MSKASCAVLLACLAIAPGHCGRLLDDLLNCPRLDAHSAQRDGDRHVGIEPGRPLGQTFVTGPQADHLFRVAIWQAFWHETWDPDESLVLTLWDGPEKRSALGRAAIPYSRRMWEQAVPLFTLDARVEPSRTHYLEFSVETEPLRPAEIPQEWVLAGRRPGFANGDGRIDGLGVARDDYPDGQAYIAGQPQDFDLWFETHVRPIPDRDALYRQAFARFDLGHPPLQPVRDAVQGHAWDEAVDALIAHFEGREDLVPADRHRSPNPGAFDLREADLAVEHRVRLADGTTVDLGPEWAHLQQWPERGGVGLTRSGLRKALAAAYERTSNEKYAQAFNDLLIHHFLQLPSPLCAGVFGPADEIPAALPTGLAGGSMWSGLSIAARMSHGFHYYTRFVDSPYFARDVRAAFIFDLAEMAEVLERMKGGGNWETQMADSLFDFGLTYPEFAGARRWTEQGLDTLVQNALSTVRPDGCLQEPSINYHQLVMGRYAGVIERTRRMGLKLPAEMVALTERMHEYPMYSTLPDGTLPLWGDANPPSTPAQVGERATLFGREDFRFVATGGREGAPPAKTSIGFPDGGFYYLRSGWGADANYMAVRCGPFGSHGHFDALSLIVSAFGRLALIDPGVYTYGTPESRELSATRSHNTVTVDGADAASASADRWVAAERFDYLAGHNDGYRGIEGARHDRRVWFLKPLEAQPALWLVLDEVTGPGEHESALRYRFAPGAVEADGLRVRTAGEGPGLLIACAGSPTATLRVSEGIAAAAWEGLTKAPVAELMTSGALPARFVSVLVPYRSAPPTVTVAERPIDPPQPGTRATWAALGGTAVLCLSDATAEMRTSLPDGTRVDYAGAAAVIRFARDGDAWRPMALHGVDVSLLRLGDEALLDPGGVLEQVDRLLTADR
jgi:hypothetical protein